MQGSWSASAPLSAIEPWGSGGLPRLTSSQGEHKRSPFSWNTHLPGAGRSLALPTLWTAHPLSLTTLGQTEALPAHPSGYRSAQGTVEVAPWEDRLPAW